MVAKEKVASKSFLYILLVLFILVIVTFLIVIFLFFTGCTKESSVSQEISPDNEKGIIASENVSDENISEESAASAASEKGTESLCTSGWKCISSDTKAYQSENCSWREKEECSSKCKNGNCTCVEGFECKNGSIRGYQIEECGWIHEQYCSFGCVQRACLSFPQKKPEPNKPSEESESASVNEAPAVPATEIAEGVNYQLTLGEKKKISFKSKEYEIWLYNLEEGRVKINLDDWESDWLADKENYTFGGEVQIFIDEILFQPYDGGKKIVSYYMK